MLHQNVLSQIKRIQLSCFLPLNIISLVVLSLILFFTNINIYAAQVSLTWGTNSESDLSGYKIYYGNSSGSYDSNIDVGNQTNYTVTGLVEGETNYFTLTAYDTSGNESSYSGEVVYNVPILDLTAPTTPAIFTAYGISTSQINISWNVSTDNVGVTGYRIYRDGIQVADISSTTYQDTGLSPSTMYSYTVTAYDAAGNESGQSSTSSATTLSLPVNNPPVLSSIGNKSVNEGQALSFTISATDPDGDTLSYTTNNLPSGASFNENTKTFAWTPTYNQAGTYSNITFQVSDGNDIDLESITITVGNINRPPVLDPISDITINEGVTIAINPTATDPDGDTLTYTYTGWMTSSSYTTNYNDIGTHTVTVTVSDGTLTDSQVVTVIVLNSNSAPVLDPITDITVNEGATITLSPTATDPDGDTLTYTYTGWMTSSNYTTNYNDSGTHTVTVTVSDGTLSDSQNVMITIIDVDTILPSAPANLQATAISTSQINLSWNASTDNVGVTGYKIFRDSSQVGTSVTTSYSDTGLSASTTYTYTVSAYDAASNESAQSSAVQATTLAPDTESPSTPTNPAANAISPTEISLTWTASTDNVGVAGYKIFRDSSQVGTSVTTSFSDTGLSASTTYNYTVSAYDAAGNESGQSSPVSATTLIATISLASSNTMVTNSQNFALTHPVNNLWDGITNSGSTGTAGAGNIASFWVEFDFGQNYDLTSSQLFGDAKGKWVSNTWTLQYKQNLGDSWNTAFSGANALVTAWVSQNLAVTARYVRVEVFGNPTTQARELEIYGTPGSVDIQPPSTPANIQATASSNTKMNLSWNASSDNVGVTGYRIYRDGIQVADVSSTTYQDTGLSKGTTYVYTVSAYDAAGNESSQSAPLATNTKSPGKPTGMRIVGT